MSVWGSEPDRRGPQRGVQGKAGPGVLNWETQLRGLLEEAQALGEVDPDLDPKEAAAFLIDCYEGLLVRMKVDGDRTAFRRFRRHALEPLGITVTLT